MHLSPSLSHAGKEKSFSHPIKSRVNPNTKILSSFSSLISSLSLSLSKLRFSKFPIFHHHHHRLYQISIFQRIGLVFKPSLRRKRLVPDRSWTVRMRQHFSSLLNGLAKSISLSLPVRREKRGSEEEAGREAAEALVREAKKRNMILRSCGNVDAEGCKIFASVHSKKGEKGVNQDCCLVWEEFGCQEDMIFCGVFDGHGPWGHFVAKKVRESLPSSLLCNWQETLTLTPLDSDFDLEQDKKVHQCDAWRHSYIKTCAVIDKELEKNRRLDSFHSGTTALTVVKQGDVVVIANVGDSRAVLATTMDDGNLVPVQLTVDFKPSLPQEAERITQCKGRVFCLEDEPGLHRLWLPDGETPGLAMSRAFGDYCVKDFGLISVPEVTQRHVTNRDQFIVLATDGVWDVISNQEAVEIVSSTPERGKSAKRLVECAARAWKRKRRGVAVDDCSAICLFFHCSSPLIH